MPAVNSVSDFFFFLGDETSQAELVSVPASLINVDFMLSGTDNGQWKQLWNHGSSVDLSLVHINISTYKIQPLAFGFTYIIFTARVCAQDLLQKLSYIRSHLCFKNGLCDAVQSIVNFQGLWTKEWMLISNTRTSSCHKKKVIMFLSSTFFLLLSLNTVLRAMNAS